MSASAGPSAPRNTFVSEACSFSFCIAVDWDTFPNFTFICDKDTVIISKFESEPFHHIECMHYECFFVYLQGRNCTVHVNITLPC